MLSRRSKLSLMVHPNTWSFTKRKNLYIHYDISDIVFIAMLDKPNNTYNTYPGIHGSGVNSGIYMVV